VSRGVATKLSVHLEEAVSKDSAGQRAKALVTRLLRLFLLLTAAATLSHAVNGWNLVWGDEFNGPAGSAPDPARWNYDLGGGGWGNGEAEIYTNSPQNVFMDGTGNLVIRAIRDDSGNYTSARLQTGNPGASTQTTDLSWQYGRIEARIKLPFGHGVWPAFWMLGENIGTTGWPVCGEVDIMESFGPFDNNASINDGTAHGPGYSGAGGITEAYTMPFGERTADDFHVYAIEWSPNSIEWFVDGVSYHTVTPASLPSGRQWVFNNSFFILLNLAIGGPSTFLGTPDPNAPFPPQDMVVDYVRVYKASEASQETPVIVPGQVLNAASLIGALAPGSLASVYGLNLAAAEQIVSGVDQFPFSVAGVHVTVDGVSAPLLYVSPGQINFQIPWETMPGLAVQLKVIRDGIESNVELLTVEATAPSLFLSEFVNGVAWVTGDGCPWTECSVQPGASYQLWANGFGPKDSVLYDGVPAPLSGSLPALDVPGGPTACQLTVGGQVAVVLYCGAAPGEIIDQLNFIYPDGVISTTPYIESSLTISGVTGWFRLPAPVASP
jgi:uncharacterized protein (TIGR03437 family)